jgi:hypothetical protein
VESHVTCLLKCGVGLRIPISLIDLYNQPLPLPSSATAKRIRQVVRDLDSDDWKTREHAQNQILMIGPPAMAVLKQLQPSAPAEAAQRIELIINRLSSQLEKANGVSNGTGEREADDALPPDPGVLDGWRAVPN